MYVNSNNELAVVRGDLPADLARALVQCSRVAWDIETTGLDWRSASLSTCQVYADQVGAVVVSVTEHVPRLLIAILEDPRIEKVFHHAPFDLRFMIHAWSIHPRSIRCTKVASKLLAPQAPNEHHSLQALLQRHLGVWVGKGPVRTSDWSAPTLSAEQVKYAVEDVVHLPSLLDKLQEQMKAVDLVDLYDACCAFLPARAQLELGSFPDVFAY
jgi:ribonuclease D